MHTGEKIYECPHCPGKRFAQNYGMLLHIRKCHEKDASRRETCSICGVKTQTKAKMKLHMAKLHGMGDENGSVDFESSKI